MNPKKYSILCIALAVLILSPAGFAHARVSAKQILDQSQSNQDPSAKPESTELEEAADLSSRVLKLYAERKFKEALPLAKRALEIREKALGADPQLVRIAQINLAEVYIALGKYGDAESPLKGAVKSFRTADANDFRLADTLERIALTHYAIGDPGKAESAYEEALQIREKVFGVANLKTALSLLMLAEFHQLEGNDEKAATFYERLISVNEKHPGQNNEQLVDAISRYVCLLGKLNKTAEAEKWNARLTSLRGPNPAGSTSVKAGSSAEEFLKAGILNGKAISLAKPDYPPEARNARVSGTVVVQVWIDETGRVFRACAVSGASKLRRSSELAAYRSQFSPTKLSGKPVKVTGVITYNYVAR
ncbi:MAG TPA: TonB family protein [Pyrinomonadaceae bacterium]|nr:TonB family protein [Pyrinomonadaceae bacterium]